MRRSAGSVFVLMVACAIASGCVMATAGPAPTPTFTKTPKPTFTATATFTATPQSLSQHETATAAQPVSTEATVTASPTSPEAEPTPTAGAVATPTATPMPRPTNTPAPPPPTNTPAPTLTPTPRPHQFTGTLIWDDQSFQCAFLEIRKASKITDAAGNPVNGVCVCLQLYDKVYRSFPSGPEAPGYYEPGHYDISNLIIPPSNIADVTAYAFVCDCGSGAPLDSDVVPVEFTSSSCNQPGGHQSAIVNWVKNW